MTKTAKGGRKIMTSGFPHQNPLQNFNAPKTDPLPQHGQEADKTLKPKAARVVKPRPGH